MNTNSSSTTPFPRLERLLLDADVNVDLEPLLRAVGFRVEFAFRVANVRRDRDILRWARRHRSFYVCHDKFSDKQTRLEIYPEIYDHGGKVIQITGGPQQNVYTSLGKLLVHREKWVEWFQSNEGIVTLSMERMRTQDAQHLYTIVHGTMDLAVDPEGTMQRRRIRKTRRRRVGRQTPVEQRRLPDYDDDVSKG